MNFMTGFFCCRCITLISENIYVVIPIILQCCYTELICKMVSVNIWNQTVEGTQPICTEMHTCALLIKCSRWTVWSHWLEAKTAVTAGAAASMFTMANRSSRYTDISAKAEEMKETEKVSPCEMRRCCVKMMRSRKNIKAVQRRETTTISKIKI